MFRAIARVVVLVEDQEAALAFYRDVVGAAVLHDETAGGFRFLHVGFPGHTTGIWLMPGAPQPGDQPQVVLCTSDLDRVRERLSAHGVDVWAERDDHTGRSLHFLDVAGNVIVAAEIPGFDLPAFRDAYQDMDVDRLMRFYAPDAVWIERGDAHASRAPRVLRGREEIEPHLRALADGPLEIAVGGEVLGDERLAFTVIISLNDGRRVLQHVNAELRDGVIAHHAAVAAWA